MLIDPIDVGNGVAGPIMGSEALADQEDEKYLQITPGDDQEEDEG